MRRFSDVSIQAKLLTVSLLTTGCALLFAWAAILTWDVMTFREALVRKLATQAEIVGRNSTAAIIFDDPDAAAATLAALRAEPQIIEAVIRLPDGRSFARYGPPGATDSLVQPVLANAPVQEGFRFDENRLLLSRLIVDADKAIGSVTLHADTGEITARVTRFASVAATFLIFAMLVTVPLSSRLQRAVSEPIRQLSVLARRVSGERDYSLRAAPMGRDETGELVESFNDMLAEIQHRDQALRAEIGQRRRAQSELATARDAALESSRLKSEFLANMSHEIRTPLNIILGYSQLLREELRSKGDASQEEIFDKMSRASQRLIQTIHGILDISKIESRAFEISLDRIDLGPFVQAQVEEFEVLAREKGIALICDIAAGGTVTFDSYCLSHALANLLDNAIKFTGRGEVRVALVRGDDGRLCIRVSDTGVGIDESYMPHLYESFTQERSGYTRPYEGSGLGLALAKRFLEMNGATISVESRKGIGSTFTIHFASEDSFDSAAPEPHQTTVPDGSIAPAAGDREKPLVLVVEDDAGTQMWMQRLLGPRYDVACAASAAEARNWLAAHGDSVGIVLMDLSLKGDEDGLALTRALRRRPELRALPIVAVTAHAFPEDRANALAAGCDAYLAKPIDNHELLRLMNELTAEPRARRA
ncbi:MAG TPA: ATP-binding protein [Terriglobales bacterium]|nr:ATP-binding protein [Terriglobales bacterium]